MYIGIINGLNFNPMKTSRSNNTHQNKQQNFTKKPRPEIRDDLDSRKEKEAGYKGDKSKKGDRKKKGEGNYDNGIVM